MGAVWTLDGKEKSDPQFKIIALQEPPEGLYQAQGMIRWVEAPILGWLIWAMLIH